MPTDKDAKKLRIVRHRRVRKNLSGNPERPRLSVFRSAKHIYAQVIDDTKGVTIVAASTLEPKSNGQGASTRPKLAASGLVGKLIAERAIALGVSQVVFDRGGYKYHGRVKALAEASREAGLKF
jgi:large subunit ribosomal protein L18